MQIIVNGEEMELEGESLSHEHAVSLAFPGNSGKSEGYTVYVRGTGDPKVNETVLAPQRSITARHNMVVTVSYTDTAPSVA